MKISRQILLAFLVILAIVVVGFVINLRLLFKMVETQEHVDEEWNELNRMVEIQKILARINDQIEGVDVRRGGKQDLIWNISLLQDKIHQVSFEREENNLEDQTTHHRQEEIYFEDFMSSMGSFLEKLPSDSVHVGLDAPDLEVGVKETLLKAERAGYGLQQTDMFEMMSVTRQAEKLRREIVRWSLGIFVVLVLIIAVFSLWFVWIFRKKTDILIRDEQLVTMAVMAQSLAHEIRNPLGIIKSSTSILKRKVESDAEGRELLGYLVEEVDRIDDLLKQLSHLSEGNAVYQMENVSQIVVSVCALMKSHAEKSGIEISYEDKTRGTRIPCHGHQIKQLVMNLLFNAIQASERGGKIQIETLLDKGMYHLMVKDAGRGIDPKNMKRLFEPFFTTKSQGAGLGLVVVKKIVDWHKGRIDVSSLPGQGTTFHIYFPKDSYDHRNQA